MTTKIPKIRRKQVWIDESHVKMARTKAKKEKRSLKSTIEMAIEAAMADGKENEDNENL
jgi:hypothetical protein